MGTMLEVEVPQKVFDRRIQPFGIALAEVSWRVKMFTHDGVVLAALYLEEPNVIVAFSFWPREEDARSYFKGAFEICLSVAGDPHGRVRLDVQLDAATIDELFTAAELINPHPDRISARRAEQHFTNFLTTSFPDTLVTWARTLRWLQEPLVAESGMLVRVG